MKLTQRVVETLTCGAGRKDRLVADSDQLGLMVRVSSTGSRTYLAQFAVNGTKRRVPVGNVAAISLGAAREAVRAMLGDVARGGDPAADRRRRIAAAKAEKDRLTLEQLIDSWAKLHLVHKKPRYAAEAVRALTQAFPKKMDQPADTLDRAAVVQVLDRLAGEGSGAMASRTRAYGNACYRWAVKRGAVTANPFAALPAIGPSTKRDRVLCDSEVIAVWNAAVAEPPPFGRIVRMLILTGQRREEVAAMTWGEVSADFATWTIPGSRTKNSAPHIVPLSAPVRDLLRSLPRDDGLVMPGGAEGPFGGWSKAKSRLDKACGVTDWTLHDLRRTLATGMQRLGVRLEVTEAVLNHISGSRSGIVGIYQRHDWRNEKAAALEAWGAHVLAAVKGGEAASNVVNLIAASQ